MPRRRASAVLLKGDRLLMVRISDHGRTWWCLPGGTIEPDEIAEGGGREDRRAGASESRSGGREAHWVLPLEPSTPHDDMPRQLGWRCSRRAVQT